MVASESKLDEQAKEMKLRWEFVGMLFALTVAKIAENTAPLLAATWRLDLVQASRLLLVGFVVASSWIGWSMSRAKGAEEPVGRVFSAPFAVLVIDVVLVIVYFKMAEGIGRGRKEDTIPLPEALWSTVIFFLYVIWDVVTKVLVRNGRDGTKRMISTVVCLAVTAAILAITAGATASDFDVVMVNTALLLVFVAFRAAKDRPPLRRLFRCGSLVVAMLLATAVRF